MSTAGATGTRAGEYVGLPHEESDRLGSCYNAVSRIYQFRLQGVFTPIQPTERNHRLGRCRVPFAIEIQCHFHTWLQLCPGTPGHGNRAVRLPHRLFLRWRSDGEIPVNLSLIHI